MLPGLRALIGASLPRTQQLIVVGLGLGLAVLVAWRAGLLWRPAPTGPSLQTQYFVDVQGNLPCPGVQVFAAPPTIQGTWQAAGGQGTLPAGGRRLESGARLIVAPDGNVTVGRMAGPELLSLGLALDPNQATAADLEAIPGLGPVLAQRLVEHREVHGPFAGLEDLLAVKGLGPKNLEKIRPYLVIIADNEKTP